MKNRNDIILAISNSGNEIKIKTIKEWINNKNENKLSQFLYDRLYGRYIKPFQFDDEIYRKNYKNGFAMMSSGCLLIETYVSFVEKSFIDTKGKSERCFGWFFNEVPEFIMFSENGLKTKEYLKLDKRINNKGLPRDFYRNVRCGILHNGETRNNWKIKRNGDFFCKETKSINATKFIIKLEKIIVKHKLKLEKSNWDDEIWKTYISRIKEIIKRT